MATMHTRWIGESFRLGHSHTTGPFHTRLKESVRARYRPYGSAQDAYELVIDAGHQPKVRRASKDGTWISLRDLLRYGLRARFALVYNQPVITPLLPSLIPLNDPRLGDDAVWHLLSYRLEWKVESSEQFYACFLRSRPFIAELDVLAAIADDLRSAYLECLPDQSAHERPVEPLPQATLNEQLIPQANERLAHMGIRLRRFYPPAAQEPPGEAIRHLPQRGIFSTRINLRHAPPPSQTPDAEGIAAHAAIRAGLLSHLCCGASLAHQWFADVLRACGFELAPEEIEAALIGPPPPSSAHPASHTVTHTLTPALVVQRLAEAGRDQVRRLNKTTPQESQRRNRLRRKALAFFELAHLLNDSPPVVEASENAASTRSVRLELLTRIRSLHAADPKQTARIAFHPGSAVHLIALAAQAVQAAQEPEAAGQETIQLVREILPLATASWGPSQDAVEVWSPAGAAKRLDFTGAAPEFDLTLQVLEPTAALHSEAEAPPTAGPGASILFWTWKVRALRDRFSVRLRPTADPLLYDVEVQEAEFVSDQPLRSTEFPQPPRFRQSYEPVELALLIDGYWLADEGSDAQRRHTGLALLTELLDGLDAMENVTRRGLLIHAAICLDTHLSHEFQAAYGAVPSLYTLEDSPIETTSQLVAEWLQPWVERWREWEIKPYAVDTDISLEQGLSYLRRLRWQQTGHPTQRAVLVVGRSRPHDHVKYFTGSFGPELTDAASVSAWSDIPYHSEDRFSVTDVDWREDLRAIRQRAATVLALCDPGLPNPHCRLPTHHRLYRQYQTFWAAVDPGTQTDVDDQEGVPCAAMGVDRVLETMETQLFRRRAARRCEPPLTLPLSQLLPVL